MAYYREGEKFTKLASYRLRLEQDLVLSRDTCP